jgi:hypothetical protein
MLESWRDPSAAWWAKTARAGKHIDDIRYMINDFERRKPYEIRRESTEHPDEVAFRFHINSALPTELLTTVGDALHNMRSCLDSVAFDLARRHLDNQMSEEQEEASQFPISSDASRFDAFFNHRIRRTMYGDQERAALRCVQPFAFREEALAHGVDVQTSPEYEFLFDELHRLRTLSNLDKHRRLPLLVWYVDFLYWDNPAYSWRYSEPRMADLENTSLIGYLTGAGDGPARTEATFDVKLSLADDPAFEPGFMVRNDLVGVLERWHYYLEKWVLPRVFIVADGNPPPIIISG